MEKPPFGSLTKAELEGINPRNRKKIWWVWLTKNGYEVEGDKVPGLNLRAKVYFFTNYWHAYAHCLKCQHGDTKRWNHESYADWVEGEQGRAKKTEGILEQGSDQQPD